MIYNKDTIARYTALIAKQVQSIKDNDLFPLDSDFLDLIVYMESGLIKVAIYDQKHEPELNTAYTLGELSRDYDENDIYDLANDLADGLLYSQQLIKERVNLNV